MKKVILILVIALGALPALKAQDTLSLLQGKWMTVANSMRSEITATTIKHYIFDQNEDYLLQEYEYYLVDNPFLKIDRSKIGQVKNGKFICHINKATGNSFIHSIEELSSNSLLTKYFSDGHGYPFTVKYYKIPISFK